jgi:predicted membrane protein
MSSMIFGIVFGVIGIGYYTYGKRQSAIVPKIIGVSLFIFPYFIVNIYILVLVGIVLSLIPYFIKF